MLARLLAGVYNAQRAQWADSSMGVEAKKRAYFVLPPGAHAKMQLSSKTISKPSRARLSSTPPHMSAPQGLPPAVGRSGVLPDAFGDSADGYGEDVSGAFAAGLQESIDKARGASRGAPAGKAPHADEGAPQQQLTESLDILPKPDGGASLEGLTDDDGATLDLSPPITSGWGVVAWVATVLAYGGMAGLVWLCTKHLLRGGLRQEARTGDGPMADRVLALSQALAHGLRSEVSALIRRGRGALVERARG